MSRLVTLGRLAVASFLGEPRGRTFSCHKASATGDVLCWSDRSLQAPQVSHAAPAVEPELAFMRAPRMNFWRHLTSRVPLGSRVGTLVSAARSELSFLCAVDWHRTLVPSRAQRVPHTSAAHCDAWSRRHSLDGSRELALLTILIFHRSQRLPEAPELRWVDIHSFRERQQARHSGFFGCH